MVKKILSYVSILCNENRNRKLVLLNYWVCKGFYRILAWIMQLSSIPQLIKSKLISYLSFEWLFQSLHLPDVSFRDRNSAWNLQLKVLPEDNFVDFLDILYNFLFFILYFHLQLAIDHQIFLKIDLQDVYTWKSGSISLHFGQKTNFALLRS